MKIDRKRIQTERQTDKLKDKQTNRQTDKQTNRQTDKQTNRQTNKRQRERERKRRTDRCRDTEREREKASMYIFSRPAMNSYELIGIYKIWQVQRSREPFNFAN